MLDSNLSHFSFFSRVSSDAANNLISRAMNTGSKNLKWEVGDTRLVHSTNGFQNYYFLNNFLTSNSTKSPLSNFNCAKNSLEELPTADIIDVEIPVEHYFSSFSRCFKYFSAENNVNQINCIHTSGISENYSQGYIEEIERGADIEDNFELKIANRIEQEDDIDINFEGEIKGL